MIISVTFDLKPKPIQCRWPIEPREVSGRDFMNIVAVKVVPVAPILPAMAFYVLNIGKASF